MIKIESCKGDYQGTAADCQAFLDELQPAFASVVIGGKSETIESDVRSAVVEMSDDIDGGEPEWQKYMTTDQIAELIEQTAAYRVEVAESHYDFETMRDAQEWAHRASLVFDIDEECQEECERLIKLVRIRERDAV